MSVQSTNEINESDVNYIQQSEIDSCELHFVEKETQTFQETYHDVGIQMSPPSKQSNSMQTENTINCKSSESQCDYCRTVKVMATRPYYMSHFLPLRHSVHSVDRKTPLYT